jgi:8-oxo-dGTP diphosphatase
MDSKEKSRAPILAAGGIVLRNDLDFTARFAIVRSRKLDTWGLPKGKLAAGEDALTAARREVLEETGHRVTAHEFLGTLVYETSGRPKVVQFWRMEAAGAPEGVLMRDVKAVDWLVLDDAIDRLSHLRERVFLEQVGPIALKHSHRLGDVFRQELFQGEARGILVPDVPRSPEHELVVRTGLRPFGPQSAASLSPAAQGPAQEHAGQIPAQAPETACGGARHLGEKSLAGKTLMKKTWGWFRYCRIVSFSIETLSLTFRSTNF